MRRLGLAAVLVSMGLGLARCLFPSLDGLTAKDASTEDAASEAGPGISFVQGSASSPFPPATATLPAAINAGDTLVVCSSYPVDFGSLQVTDTLNRTYTLFATQDGYGKQTTWHQACFVSIGGPGGNDTISFSTTSSTLVDGAAHDLEAYVFEYQGIGSIDSKLTVAGMIDAGPDSSWDAGSIATSMPNELLFAWAEAAYSARLDPSFTWRTTFDDNNVGDKIVATPGTYPITGTADNNWVVIAATFKGP